MRYIHLILATAFSLSLVSYADGQTTQPSAAQVTPEQRMDRLLVSPPSAGQAMPTKAGGRAIDNSTGKSAVAPDAPALPVVREGTHLINRSGRLNHSPDGQQAIFTFDADGKTMSDPPMIILPNLTLQSMEGAILSKSSDVHFRISGSVTEYKGRNHILLEKAVVMADVEQTF